MIDPYNQQQLKPFEDLLGLHCFCASHNKISPYCPVHNGKDLAEATASVQEEHESDVDERVGKEICRHAVARSRLQEALTKLRTPLEAFAIAKLDREVLDPVLEVVEPEELEWRHKKGIEALESLVDDLGEWLDE